MEDREVLPVPVGGCEEPKGQLCQQKGGLIVVRMRATGQQSDRALDRGSTIGLIAFRGWQPRGLTEILLWQTGNPDAAGWLEGAPLDFLDGCAGPATVEAPHHQHALLAKGCDFALGYGQAELPQHLSAEPFVFDQIGEISPEIAYQPDGEFQDVGRGSRPDWPIPAS